MKIVLVKSAGILFIGQIEVEKPVYPQAEDLAMVGLASMAIKLHKPRMVYLHKPTATGEEGMLTLGKCVGNPTTIDIATNDFSYDNNDTELEKFYLGDIVDIPGLVM
jgi:hypothetical protein